MQRIASAGVLLVALALSLLAIGKLNTGPVAGSTTSSNDVVSVAANSDPGLVAEYPIVGQEALVQVFGQVAVQTTDTAFAAVNVAPAVDSRHIRPPTTHPHSTTTQTRPSNATTTHPHSTTTRPTNPIPTTTRPNPPETTTTSPQTTTTSTQTSTTTAPPTEGDRWISSVRGIDGLRSDAFWWDATYLRNLSYTANTGWVDGDRHAYQCLYGFLVHNNEVVGRVTFTVIPEAASYAQINDKWMLEGERYYDGTLAAANAPIELHDCPEPSESYSALGGADQRPTITYSTSSGELLEVRNYKATVVGEGITFQQVGSTDQRVTVVAYKDNLPAIVIYYDSMVPGVVMNSDLG